MLRAGSRTSAFAQLPTEPRAGAPSLPAVAFAPTLQVATDSDTSGTDSAVSDSIVADVKRRYAGGNDFLRQRSPPTLRLPQGLQSPGRGAPVQSSLGHDSPSRGMPGVPAAVLAADRSAGLRGMRGIAAPSLPVHADDRHSWCMYVIQIDARRAGIHRDDFIDALVHEARVESVMTAYNRVNGEPASASPTLVARLLRQTWGFEGYVVSDCWAIRDIHEQHQVTPGPVESAAMALLAGCDLNCGCTYEHLPEALKTGLITEADLDRALERLLRVRLRLGMFDPPDQVPFAAVPFDVVDSAEHRALARRAAQRSLVLLKNNGILPLPSDLKSVAVIGPNADAPQVLWANYCGTASRTVTPLEGIRARLAPGARLYYAEGCKHQGTELSGCAPQGNLTEAVLLAQRADVTVLVLGLTPLIEGEQGDAGNSQAAGDKLDLDLPGLQQQLLEAVVAVGKPVVLVLVSGSPLAVNFAEEHAAAVVQAFYGGEEGGSALADVLFGDVDPAGRLPVTFPRSLADLPPFEDYAMFGRTYRYLQAEPLYPFGFGLSYTRFGYSGLVVSRSQAECAADLELEVTVRVENVGKRSGEEVAQLYLQLLDAPVPVPRWDLRGFARIQLEAGASQQLQFRLDARALSYVDEYGVRWLGPGRVRFFVGGSQPDARSIALLGQAPLELTLELGGAPVAL